MRPQALQPTVVSIPFLILLDNELARCSTWYHTTVSQLKFKGSDTSLEILRNFLEPASNLRGVWHYFLVRNGFLFFFESVR